MSLHRLSSSVVVLVDRYERGKVRKTFAVSLLVVGLSASGGLVLPGVAGAAPAYVTHAGDFKENNVNIRSAPNVDRGSIVYGQGNAVDGATVYCYVDGENPKPSGEGTDEWFNVRDNRTGVSGYVYGDYISWYGTGPMQYC
jgi:hypothetical protein